MCVCVCVVGGGGGGAGRNRRLYLTLHIRYHHQNYQTEQCVCVGGGRGGGGGYHKTIHKPRLRKKRPGIRTLVRLLQQPRVFAPGQARSHFELTPKSRFQKVAIFGVTLISVETLCTHRAV